MREDYYPDQGTRSPSPGLEPIKINYKPEVTPPPYITTSSSSSSSQSPREGEVESDDEKLEASIRPSAAEEGSRKRRRKARHRPCQGDAVLINYLDPNRPDIAREAAQHALNSASQSEDEHDSERSMSGVEGEDEDERDHGRTPRAIDLENTAHAALNDVVMAASWPSKPKPPNKAEMQGPSSRNVTVATRRHEDPDLEGTPRPWQPPISLRIAAPLVGRRSEGDDDSIASSPALAKYAISAAQANRESTLPAMQMSPPRSASACSPDGSQSLPSLHTALSQIVDVPMTDRPKDTPPHSASTGQASSTSRLPFMSGSRGQPGPSPSVYCQPSPSSAKEGSHLSSMGHSDYSKYWPGTSNQGSLDVPASLISESATSLPFSTPYLTPKDDPSPERISSPWKTSNGPFPAPAAAAAATTTTSTNGSSTTNTFKCTHPGCTAEPFQTQYLLNSHANVHSSNRPYYCPVRSCPRSFGGKGFKRKNEMNRHGLVHDSPGYACPFCSDQQHKYPRPDNLQRHVRVHHPEKGRDDTELRAVLALRSPAAGAGGAGGGAATAGSDGKTTNRIRRRRVTAA